MSIRISEFERKQFQGILKKAYSEDRLDEAEFENRLEQLNQAVCDDEALLLVKDLPQKEFVKVKRKDKYLSKPFAKKSVEKKEYSNVIFVLQVVLFSFVLLGLIYSVEGRREDRINSYAFKDIGRVYDEMVNTASQNKQLNQYNINRFGLLQIKLSPSKQSLTQSNQNLDVFSKKQFFIDRKVNNNFEICTLSKTKNIQCKQYGADKFNTDVAYEKINDIHKSLEELQNKNKSVNKKNLEDTLLIDDIVLKPTKQALATSKFNSKEDSFYLDDKNIQNTEICNLSQSKKVICKTFHDSDPNIEI